MGSTRLPGKILMPLNGHSLLEHIILRLSRLRHEAMLVIATTVNEDNNAVESLCRNLGVTCFRGSEENVLERFYLCAMTYGFNHIVRLTGDNPFTDIVELDNLIDLHLHTGSDFSHSLTSLPVGVGAAVFTFNALEKCHLEGKAPHHQEHVDEYVLEHPEIFKISILEVPKSKHSPDIRLTIDTEEDYRKARYIIAHASSLHLATEEAIRLCMQYA
jgi:spore coat polysaccharide biosynthesis protein SpsF